MRIAVGVVICIKDAEKYIAKCIESVLDQSFKNFELVIINDGSTDNTESVIREFNDTRIRYFKNKKNLGIAKSRNKGLRLFKGQYVFFTDGDCVVSKNWIEEGLKFLEDPNCVGVEGKIYYVSEEYKPTFSDHLNQNPGGGGFMTGNMAYKRSIFERVGGFDERYSYFEDRDLGLRILRSGKINFNPNMIVYVQQQTLTPKEFIKEARVIENRVYLFKRFGETPTALWRIVHPVDLAKILFPPLIFASLFFNTFKTREGTFKTQDDYKLLPFTYIRSILERLQLWNTCAKERVFLI
jgi:glycosyltransferase involved in cell wall biosynthesis